MTSKIHIPTFDATVVFVHDVDRERLRRYALRAYKAEIVGLEDEYSGITADLGDLTWLVYVPDTKSGDFVWLARTLSHEASHVALQMMRKLGIAEDETACYTQDNIFGQLLLKAMKRGRGR